MTSLWNLEELVTTRRAELHGAAQRAAAARRRRGRARQRVGWLIVAAGLRLALGRATTARRPAVLHPPALS